jgi:hypothetical protein
MKTPQRPFIVEHKSGRRRSTTRPKSIWGDTDLKALAKAAESDAPHLFKLSSMRELPVEPEEARPSKVSSSADVAAGTTDPSRPVTAVAVPSEAEPEPGVDFPVQPVRQARKKKVKPQKLSSREAGQLSRADKVSASRREEPVGLNQAAEDLSRELVELDDENRRLKLLLAERLNDQNHILREMLARFDR